MSYDEEIKKNDLITTYLSQVSSVRRAKNEVLKMKQNIIKYDETLKSLDEAIAETKAEMAELGITDDEVKGLF